MTADISSSSRATLTLAAAIERWPIDGAFTIARGSKREAVVVVATVSDGALIGRGECVPYARYGETPEATVADLNGVGPEIDPATTMRELAGAAARNALDCALIDLEAKRRGVRVHNLYGLSARQPVLTCYTLSLDTPEAMAAKARGVPHLPLLKLKLGRDGDVERMRAVRVARPQARLVADANEGWTADTVETLLVEAAAQGFELIEQPLPTDADSILESIRHHVPVCADESAHDAASIAGLMGRYDAVNIKLDKTGGLTAARLMADAARAHGLAIMVGCMVATSLSMAPALLLAADADWVDLDGPLLLAKDRPNGLVIRDGWIMPSEPALWG